MKIFPSRQIENMGRTIVLLRQELEAAEAKIARLEFMAEHRFVALGEADDEIAKLRDGLTYVFETELPDAGIDTPKMAAIRALVFPPKDGAA